MTYEYLLYYIVYINIGFNDFVNNILNDKNGL